MKSYSIVIRYLILVLIAIPDLYLFYLIFTPLTVYSVYFLLNLFYDISLTGVTIYVAGASIELVKACIAGSAYYLLVILNLLTPGIKSINRIKIIISSFISLLILNILRIFILSLLFISGSNLFDITHKIFWYAMSIIFVVAIWFIHVRLYNIKQIPVYSDVKFILLKISGK